MAKSQGEGLKHKIKSLLGLRKTNTIQTSGIEHEEDHGYIFSADVLKELSKESNVNHRARVLKELSEVVSVRKLEEHAAEAVWHEISDMLQSTVPTEARQTTLKFLVCLVNGQLQWLGMLRAQFLRLIENHNVREDLSYRIELLRALTDNGKDVSYCEHFGPFLLRFSQEALMGDRTEEYLQFLINLVHYNSSFLDKEIITGLVEQACTFCNKAKAEKEIEGCLHLLDATVRYGGLPSDGLYPLITTLCRTVNIERFCQASWKLMKTLVGTRLGHSTIYIMCCILEDENNMNDSILLRGAVFFIGMCVWGSKRVSSLQHKPISLLPSFKQALHCNHPIVAHEIGLSLQRLVKKYGKDLQIVTWDIILDLIDMLVKLQQNLPNTNDSLKRTVHDLLSTIEELYNAGRFDGSAERFFAIVERCSSQRPESSVLTLLTFLHKGVDPAKDRWLDKLKFIMEKYFRNGTQTAVRVKVLDILSAVIASFRFWYEEELIELSVLVYLSNIDQEKDSNVRLVTAQLLVDLITTCTSNKCSDILGIVKMLINRLMDSSGTSKKSNDEQLVTDGEHLRDIKIAVSGLVEAFKQKLNESSTILAVKILEILVEHISFHYVNGFTAHSGAIVRLEILKMFLSIRADERHRIGIANLDIEDQNNEEIRYSVFAVCKSTKGKESTGGYQLGRKLSLTKYCPTNKAFDAVLNCLKDEWEWNVLQFVLRNLPAQLRNKTLILGGDADVTSLCAFLCSMVNDGQFLNKVKNVPPGSGRAELHNLVFPILAVLVTYQDTIERQRQVEMVKSLELGLNSQCARLCVICLTICILEMKSVMLRTLPSILIKLSKISATVPMSIPMLEFLSSLKEVKDLYSNFVEEQYMSIFAIALPYTDAHRYSPYTVTLAHYVISSWFTRCRLTFRKGFVRLITKGLQSSAIIRPSAALSNEKQSAAGNKPMTVEETQEFHGDMKNVCSDMMAKYSFSTLSNQPKRSTVVDFLLSNGLSQSWLVGNTLVTVTTSGTSDKCAVCNQKRLMVTASKAAEKLRSLKLNEEKLPVKDIKSPEDKESSLSLAVEAAEFKKIDANVGYPKEDTSKEPRKQHEKADLHESNLKPPKIVGDATKAEQSSETKDEISGTQPIFIAAVEEDTATDNISQRKESRVDSAVEMKEDGESVKQNEIYVNELDPLSEVSIKINQDEDDADANIPSSHLVDKTEKEKSHQGVEISLVDRLALQEQDMSSGEMFSPTHYFLNEMGSFMETGVSATSSMEFDTGKKEANVISIEDSTLGQESSSEKHVMTEDGSHVERESSAKVTSLEAKPMDTQAVEREDVASERTTEMTDQQRKRLKTEKQISPNIVSEAEATNKTSEVSRRTLEKKEPTHQGVVKLEQEKEAPEILDQGKQTFLRAQPQSTNVSQSSSVQASPVPSKKTSLQNSIELSSEYEMVDEADAYSLSNKHDSSISKQLPDALCNCSSEGWAEIVIRRPTGNTSWVMKIENVLNDDDDRKIEDLTALSAAIEVEDFTYDIRQLYETSAEDSPSRPRFVSVATDELIKERQSMRSSSDSPKPFVQDVFDSPSSFRRRRFSTGSMDIPGAFRFSSPSPDPSKDKDDISEGSYILKYQFEKPILGKSPISPLRRHGSFSSCSDLKERRHDSVKDINLSSSYRVDGERAQDIWREVKGISMQNEADIPVPPGKLLVQAKTKQTLSKTLSSPTRIKTDIQDSSSPVQKAPPYQATKSLQFEPSNEQRGKEMQKQQSGISSDKKEFLGTKSLSSKVMQSSTVKRDGATSATIHNQDRDELHSSQRDSPKKTSQKPESNKQLKEPLKAGAQALKEKISTFSSYRPRGKTISVFPVSKIAQTSTESKDKATLTEKGFKASLNPYFVFLQFFYSPFVNGGGSGRPLLLGSGEVIDRAVKMLDRIPPYDHHKIGILYVGKHQESNETAILANQYGSPRYVQFLHGIGKLISLLDCSQTEIYTGGLDRNGADGKFAYSWRDDITQVIFHVATLMPSKQSDPACYSKKLHIGNNFVTIVYNDSNKAYKFGTIKGQFNFAEVVIKPLDYRSNLVTVRMKDDLKDVVTNTGPHVISDENLPILVRQLAIHTNMATVLHRNKNKPSDAYGCNWLERLKQIKRIRSKAATESQGSLSSASLSSSKNSSISTRESTNPDFTDYT